MTREEAITKLVAYAFWASEHVPDEVAQALDMAIEALKTDIDLDDAYEQGYACGWKERFGEPKGLHGEWELWNNPDDPYVRCIHCGTKYDQVDLYIGGCDYPNFCPNCGADMRKKER